VSADAVAVITPVAAAALTSDAAAAITSGALPLAIIVALAAGFVSFASPCVLPLVPGFLGYVTGLSGVGLEQRSRYRLVLGAFLFVLGFSVVFIAVAVTVSSAGTLLKEHESLLMRLGGIVVIVMALVFLGSGRGWLPEVRPRWKPVAGLAGAPLLGMVFGLGWAPCTGPTFGAIIALSTALSGDQHVIARGVGLATAYSAGLGVPFVLIAGGYARAGRASRWLRAHYRAIQVAGGLLLLLVGLLLVTGLWESVTTSMQSRLVDEFRTVL
jgi:cytochrome c-type biogenesis protein